MFDYKKLEFDKVLEDLNKYYVNTMSVPTDIVFSTNKEELQQEIEKTDEALRLLIMYSQTPLEGLEDIKHSLKHSEIGSVLDIKALSKIKYNLQKVKETFNYSEKFTKNLDDFPFYKSTINLLFFDKSLYTILNQNIVNEMLVDEASIELLTIRKKLKSMDIEISTTLKNAASNSEMLNDNIVTVRNGRFCLPVKSEYKNKFSGIVHDISASGETYFMEPTKVVELSTKKNKLVQEESKEITKILTIYTDRVSEFSQELANNQDIFIELDRLFAKAKYARTYNCTKQNIGDKISLNGARHPLIPQNEVVKNNIYFDNYKVVLITGPNTGGKTVTLKTLGLLALMNQYGMLLPTDYNSEIKIFDSIFADIGDEQSIQQSLSTFSSHMTNIIKILNNSTNQSLVLLDELCSGTDPKEGANLAITILEELLSNNVDVMATTHYSELKTYALDSLDIVNASTEFDVDTLKPTYKLTIGVPGKSNAFDISYKLGLPEHIVNKAKNMLTESEINSNRLFEKLEKNNKVLEDKIIELNNLVKENKEKEERLNNLAATLENKDYENKEKAKLEALNTVKEARKKVDKIIEEFSNSDKTKLHVQASVKKEIKDLESEYQKTNKTSKSTHEFSVHDLVKVLSYNQTATITKIVSKNQIEVQMGIIKTTVSRDNLEFVSRKKEEKVAKTTFKKTSKAKMEVDLRGLYQQEAIEQLDIYVHDLIASNLKVGTVIHGFGTGVLQKAVWKYLEKSKFISEFNYSEGNSGSTVIKLK